MNPNPSRPGLRLLDLSALVAGYGLAALLIRAFWPTSGLPSWAIGAVLGLVYLWLGLAMGGPIVLLVERRGGRPPYTRAELSWLLIGGYWIGLAMLVVPTRMPVSPLFGILPILVALFFGLVGPRRRAAAGAVAPWTHYAAIALVLTWPIAWGAMILLARTLF